MKYIITESQHQTLLMEKTSMYLRRRLNFDDMKDDIDSIIYQLAPCEYDDFGDFVSEICDIFTNNQLEDLVVSAKDKDSIYYYTVFLFSSYLTKYYIETCGNESMMTETQNNNLPNMKYIITESKLNKVIYDYLTDMYYPDYNWGSELHDFYRKDVNEFGSYDFMIDDQTAYVYYGTYDKDKEGKLEVTSWLSQDLTSVFGNLWIPIFIEWFQENSGLEVKQFEVES